MRPAPPAPEDLKPVGRPDPQPPHNGSCCDRVFCGNWCTHWGATDRQREFWPVRHSDYRDSAPEPLSKVYELYQPVVQEGRWTEGLLEMWFWKNKAVKHSVHIPCWDSFKWNPSKWRGICFGRTVDQCYWSGLRQMRWARAVYAAGLGREYVLPFRGVGQHGYKSEIKALCWMYFLMGCIFGCGIGQMLTCCGSCLITNFGACYSCHAREKLRRRYNLPSACGMPPGIDDCLIHFFCMYCAVHQEIRELAVRGVDGPGMHILDVLPDSFETAPGIQQVKAERRVILEGMLARPPKMFRSRVHKGGVKGHVAGLQRAVTDAARLLMTEEEGDMEVQYDAAFSSAGSETSSSDFPLGWQQYCPPNQYCAPGRQEMARGLSVPLPPHLERHSAPRLIPVVAEAAADGWGGAVEMTEEAKVQKAWSVAY